MESRTPHQYIMKLVLVGDAQAGKTCLITQLMESKFSPTYRATLGVDFAASEITVDNTQVKIQLWDSSGSPDSLRFTTSSYRNAAAFIIVFDTTNRETFENIPQWIETIENTVGKNNDAFRILFGTKIDLASKRSVTSEEAEKFAQEHSMPYFEVSAKSNAEINEALQAIVRAFIQKHSHNVSLEANPITLEEFKARYLLQYSKEFFKNPWSDMKKQLLNNNISTMAQVEQHAEEHPRSRTKLVLDLLKAEREAPTNAKTVR